MKLWNGEVKSIALALGLVLVVRTVVAEPYTVPSPSMVPTLLVGDELIGSKFAYGYGKYSSPIGLMPDFAGRVFDRAPERGDVVVFRLPRDPSQTYVKRLIGLPGDRIQMREGLLYINDKQVPREPAGTIKEDVGEGYVRDVARFRETLPNGRTYLTNDFGPDGQLDNTDVYLVPAGHYFMMGDNRDNSEDSRVPSEAGGVGYLPIENFVGKAQIVLVSWNKGASIFKPWTWVNLNFSRFFHSLN